MAEAPVAAVTCTIPGVVVFLAWVGGITLALLAMLGLMLVITTLLDNF